MASKEKVKGMFNEAVGDTKEHIGRAIGNKEMENRGHDQEMKGKAQRSVGTIKETANNLKDDFVSGANKFRNDIE